MFIIMPSCLCIYMRIKFLKKDKIKNIHVAVYPHVQVALSLYNSECIPSFFLFFL